MSSQVIEIRAQAQPAKPEKQQCRHIHANGLQCGRIATRGHATCHYHQADTLGRKGALDAACSDIFGPNTPLPLNIPLLDNQEAITLTLTNVARLMAGGTVSDKRGRGLLYALNIAQQGLYQAERMRKQAKPSEPVAPQEAVEEITLSNDGEWLGPAQKYLGPNGKAEVRWDFGKWYYVAGLKRKMIQQVTTEEVAETEFPEEGYLTEEEMANPQLVHDLCDGKREAEILAQLKEQGAEHRAQSTEGLNQETEISEQGVERQNTQNDAASYAECRHWDRHSGCG